jgi:hypothetical protein
MRIPLSHESETRLIRMFSKEDVAEARDLVESDCADNIPGGHMADLDRLRFAVLKLSGGSIPGLVDAIVLAQTDFRDALVAAGFGSDIQAHASWWPDEDRQ